MANNDPDPGHMDRFCSEFLPSCLAEVCNVPPADAALVSSDVRLRCEAVAHLDQVTREVLAAPFFEDAFHNDPLDASPWLLALTMLAVRNSQLEELHANGPVDDGGIQAITTYAVGPLSHLMSARRRQPLLDGATENPFEGLAEEYPRAWACLTALRQSLLNGGGRTGYRMPPGLPPELPDSSEATEAASADLKSIAGTPTGVIFSGIDPRFDQDAIRYMQAAQGGDLVLALSSLSRVSRNSRKLLRVLDFLLAFDTRIITTNCLITSKDAWVRTKHLVKPDSDDATMSALHDLRGLSGSHKKTAESYIKLIS